MLYLMYHKERIDDSSKIYIMIKRSLGLNLVHLIRTIVGALSDTLALYMMWFLVKWLSYEAKFDFISATMGLFIGFSLLIWTGFVRAIKHHYFGLMLSRVMIVFMFVLFGNEMYQSIVDIGTSTDANINVLMILSIGCIIFLIVGKILNVIVRKMIGSMFEHHEDDFDIISESTNYYMSGGVMSESERYRLKTFNFYNIEIEKSVVPEKK